MANAASLGVTAGSTIDSRFQAATNLIFATRAAAQDIGVLAEDTSSLQVLSQLSTEAPNDYYKFNFTSGDKIKLGLTNTTNTVTLRVQLYDVAGNVVADSGGDSAQVAAYNQLASSDGLAAANGQYTVKVSYGQNQTKVPQSYTLELYSGTTYTAKLTTSAITQAYDPNLFVSAASTVSGNDGYKAYVRTVNSNGSAAVKLGTLIKNQTELYAKGALTIGTPTDLFSFDNNASGKVKMTLTNKTDDQGLRLQIYDSTGKKLIADNQGTEAQQEAYQRITSGAGLQLDKGTYQVKVGYKAGDIKPDLSYGLQINAGTAYNKQYGSQESTTTSTSTSTTTTKKFVAGENMSIFTDLDAKLYKRNEFNQINSTAADAINIGWLRKDVSSLEVLSRLTKDNNTNFFRFTVQQSDNIKATVKSLTDDRTIRVQILDSSGYRVLADNQGTEKQKAAFNQFTSDAGLALKRGDYVMKTSYGKTETDKDLINYSVNLYSGTTYASRYRVIASAQTYQNFLARGGSIGYSAAGTYASQLQTLSQGGDLDILSGLSTSV